MSGTRPKVFVLDDEPAIRRIVRDAIERCGFEPRGGELWAEIAKEIFAIEDDDVFLVSDLGLCGIRGEDFCRTVQRYRPDVRIVLFTGAEPAQAAAVAERLGRVTLVLKTEGVAALCEALQHLARPRAPLVPPRARLTSAGSG